RATAWFRPWSSAPRVLAVHGGDIERLWVLRRMRMCRAGVDAQVAELDAAQRPARQHPLDRLLHDPLRKLSLQDRTRRALLDAADVTGVMAIDLSLALLAGEQDFFRVDNDDIVSAVDMRRIGRLVLAAQPHCHNACQPADNQAGGVDNHPLLLDIGRLGRKGFHGTASVLLAKEGFVVAAHTPGLPRLSVRHPLFQLNSASWDYGSIIPSGGIEYVDVTCATGSISPSEQIVTSPVARRLPSLSSRASATRSRGAALRKKLMLRLMVTAS